ncbi:hypothetical protein I553_8481 [Mycobacterium xenopi 4042]|uniref:Uncharacterized protein n=1 Tax=Mycobacterium xenopi 4042 TaxID=1299334 RepID=X8CLU8_MYCXE|nr:hypothetical protein I553_8481 [Mycobacterium xenopi 4042]
MMGSVFGATTPTVSGIAVIFGLLGGADRLSIGSCPLPQPR